MTLQRTYTGKHTSTHDLDQASFQKGKTCSDDRQKRIWYGEYVVILVEEEEEEEEKEEEKE